jgi:hypothetical protein
MTTKHSHKALGYTLLAYMTAMIAVVTLIPFEFAVPQTIQFSLRGNTADVINNIILFVPLGFFFQTTHGHDGLKPLLAAFCFGLVVSGMVEAGQLFLPSRYSSVLDVITNAMGAWLGAAIAGGHRWMVRQGRMWQKQNPAERRFELPTLKLLIPVYLLYLVLISVWPTTTPLSEWSLRGDFQALTQAERVLFVSRFVEVIAGFTLLGYLLAEMSGRKKETGLRSLKRVFLRDLDRVAGGVGQFPPSILIFRILQDIVEIHGQPHVPCLFGGQFDAVTPGLVDIDRRID